MKVLILNPPFVNFSGKPLSHNPALGALYITAVLDKAGHQVKMIDTDVLEYSWQKLAQRVKQDQPDIIGFTGTSMALPVILESARICKKALPNVKIIAGGKGVTIEPHKTLKDCPEIELLVLHEGEIAVLEVMDYFLGKKKLTDIKGIAYRQDGQIVINERQKEVDNLDELPWPAFHLMEPDLSQYRGIHGEYKGIKSPTYVIMASRGCPHRCIFCTLGSRKVRFRNPIKIVDEIEHHVKKYGFNSVQLYDDEFIGMSDMENDWVEKICNEIIKRDLSHLGYLVQGRCSQRFVRLETLQKMRQAGFKWIWFGVESGSSKILKYIQKDITLDDVKHTFKLCKKAKINALMFIMVGFPTETEKDVMLSAKLIKEVKPEGIRIHITTPMPGSELWRQLEAKGQIDNYNQFDGDHRTNVIHHTDELSSADIMRLYEMLKFKFESSRWYLFKFMLKSFFSIEGWKQLPKRIKRILEYYFGWLKARFS